MRGVKGRPAVLCGMQQSCIAPPSSVCDRSPATVPHPCSKFFFIWLDWITEQQHGSRKMAHQKAGGDRIYGSRDERKVKKKKRERKRWERRKLQLQSPEAGLLLFLVLSLAPVPPLALGLEEASQGISHTVSAPRSAATRSSLLASNAVRFTALSLSLPCHAPAVHCWHKNKQEKSFFFLISSQKKLPLHSKRNVNFVSQEVKHFLFD